MSVVVTPNARHRVPLAARVELQKLSDEASAAVAISADSRVGPINVRVTHMVPAPTGGLWASTLLTLRGDPEIVLRKAADALAAYIESGVTA